ncbi:hypothetical protein E2C01_039228 [Portunus trituberculatus]|uniref:Uncharacterized protein n=1 Tax=Portunus trituberculatus TaxID=210409 RepID=A0A5B7FJB1_PORTR|nr:hypothetical protein [Portunus trituberculatus]
MGAVAALGSQSRGSPAKGVDVPEWLSGDVSDVRARRGYGGGGGGGGGCVVLQGNAAAAPVRFLSGLVKVDWRGTTGLCGALTIFRRPLGTSDMVPAKAPRGGPAGRHREAGPGVFCVQEEEIHGRRPSYSN